MHRAPVEGFIRTKTISRENWMDGRQGWEGTFTSCVFTVYEFRNMWTYHLLKNENQNSSVNGHAWGSRGLPSTGWVTFPCAVHQDTHVQVSGVPAPSQGEEGALADAQRRRTCYQGTLKSSFVSGKAVVSRPHPCPLSQPVVSGIPSPPAARASFLPPRKSLWPRGGEEREAEAGKGQHPLFPKDVIHSQMSFPEARCHTASCPLNPGISSLHMTQSDGTKNREHEPVCARVCPPVHICGPRSSVHSLIHSSHQ